MVEVDQNDDMVKMKAIWTYWDLDISQGRKFDFDFSFCFSLVYLISHGLKEKIFNFWLYIPHVSKHYQAFFVRKANDVNVRVMWE